MHHQLQMHLYAPYTRTCTVKHTYVHRHTMYTYMHHQTQMCAKMHQIHIYAQHAPPNANVCIDAPYTHTCTHVHDMHHQLQVDIYAPFTHTCTTKHFCLHRCTIYTCVAHEHMFTTCITKNVHHQTPPKIKIYLVSIPSALYERPGQNERYVLNSALLLLFRCFSYEKHILGTFHEKCRCFS